MLKRIICTHGGGRFGNQLINYIHLTALGLEYPHLKIEQWELGKYLQPSGSEFIVSGGKLSKLNKVEKSPIVNKYMSAIFCKIKSLILRIKIILHHFYFHFNPGSSSVIVGGNGCNIGFLMGGCFDKLILDEHFLKTSNEIVCLAGWEFRNWNLVNKWKSEISTHLKGVFSNQESDEKSVLGVHIRGTDFKSYQGGVLYLTDKEWHLVVARFINKYKSRVDLQVYLSDEEKEWDNFIKKYSNAKVSMGSVGHSGNMFDAFSDLIQCKWVITTGSTFALMAAWIGDASVYSANDIILNNKVDPVEPDDWRVHEYLKENWM